MRWLIMIAIADLWVGLTNRNSTFYKTLFNMIAFIATFITADIASVWYIENGHNAIK
jgi:hypothetical protein